jgi:hypothetical protein
VSAATLLWHIRDSWVDYLANGQGTAGFDGALAEPPSGTPPLVREYRLPLRDGWYDPATDSASVRFTGCVRFRYALHGIAIEAQELEAEIVPGASRVIARFSGASTTPGRSLLADLAPAAPVVTGQEATWNQAPASIPTGTATSVFAGYYLPGDAFGWFTLALTTG